MALARAPSAGQGAAATRPAISTALSAREYPEQSTLKQAHLGSAAQRRLMEGLKPELPPQS